MERIILLGRAGTGKTTLARNLGQIADLPIVCLDELWQPGWNEQNVPAFRALVRDAHAGDRWISDGNFAQATFDLRLPRATLVIWLEQPRITCTLRALRRVVMRDATHRIRGLGNVLAFIWRFDRINRPRIEAARIACGANVPTRTLRGDRDIAEFLSSFAIH